MNHYLQDKSTSSHSVLGLEELSNGYGEVFVVVRCDGELGLISGTCSKSSDGLYGVTI